MQNGSGLAGRWKHVKNMTGQPATVKKMIGERSGAEAWKRAGAVPAHLK